jgi:hypothetical protein
MRKVTQSCYLYLSRSGGGLPRMRLQGTWVNKGMKVRAGVSKSSAPHSAQGTQRRHQRRVSLPLVASLEAKLRPLLVRSAAPAFVAVASAATMAPMPTAARYAPTTPATYKASREQYWYPNYPAAPKTYAAVLGMVASASSLEGLGLRGFGLGGFGLDSFVLDGFVLDGFGLGGISRGEEPQRGGYEGSPS